MVAPQAKVSYDPAIGIVHCCIKGLLTTQILGEYERALEQAVALARRQSADVLFLFDSSEASPQPPEIVERLRVFGQAIRKPEDRLAVVVTSMLVKMQADRTMKAFAFEQVFRTVAEAKAWLKS